MRERAIRSGSTAYRDRRAYRFAPPAIEIDNKATTLAVEAIETGAEPTTLANGAVEYSFEGAVSDRAHKMGIDVYVLDAGWFKRCGDWPVNTELPDANLAAEPIRLTRELGVTYFKWDAFGHYGCDREGKTVFRCTTEGPEWVGGNTLGIRRIYPGNGITPDSDPKLLKIAGNTIFVMNRWHDGNGKEAETLEGEGLLLKTSSGEHIAVAPAAR